MIEPQLKRGTTRDGGQTRYFTNATWVMPETWTCDTRAEARWFAFTHQWIRIGGAAAGLSDREIGRLIVESEVIP